MNIITNTNPIITASRELNKVLAVYTKQPVLLMLSGGSALAILENIDVSFLGPHITITTLDERFSTNTNINNFAQITKTGFYKKAMEQGVQTIETTIESNATLQETGENFNTKLHHWVESHKNNVIIATMGVGSDGHTAGIFPHQLNLNLDITNWVISYKVPPETNQYTMRITTTPIFLKTQITKAICLITGKEKRTVLDAIQSTNCNPEDMPACIMKDMPSVTIITDIY